MENTENQHDHPLEWSYTRHWSIACMQKLGNHSLWFLWGVKNHDTTYYPIWCMQESKSTCKERERNRERFRATAIESPLYLLMLRWHTFHPSSGGVQTKIYSWIKSSIQWNCPEVGFREIIIKSTSETSSIKTKTETKVCSSLNFWTWICQTKFMRNYYYSHLQQFSIRLKMKRATTIEPLMVLHSQKFPHFSLLAT